MALDSILLFAPAENCSAGVGPAAYAIGLAKAHSARLTLFVVNLDVTTPGRTADADAQAKQLCAAATDAGVDCVAITRHSHALGINEVVAEHARLHDITVTGCTTGGVLSERAMAEYLLFDSGRPVLVVPPAHNAPYAADLTVIAWDNTRAAARALGDAKPLFDKGQAILLTIDGDKQLQGDIGPDARSSILARRTIAVRNAAADRGDRMIGNALQDEAQALGADLLVMGGYGHSRLHRMVLGSATSGILDRLRMPILMSH